MWFLLTISILSIIAGCRTGERQQCLSSNGKCQDWKRMSLLVADLAHSRSAIDEEIKVEAKSNALTLLVRAASGVIGRGAGTLKTLVVNGLLLLTQTILTVSVVRGDIGGSSSKKKPTLVGSPIDWIADNSYIKTMTDDAIDETLVDRLERMASGLPCVQLLMCRLSPIVRDMQSRLIKERYYGTETGTGPAWNVSGWRRVKSAAARCSEKVRECLKTVRLNLP